MTLSSVSPSLLPGFADPVFDSQKVFRSLMSATAYPGRIHTVHCDLSGPPSWGIAAVAICLSLMDLETPLWLDAAASSEGARAYMSFHCGTPIALDRGSARFAVVLNPAAVTPLESFHAGDPEYPDRSTTLVIQVPSLTDGPPCQWSGPGINGTIEPRIGGLPDGFWSDWALNHEAYPLGVDIFFVAGRSVVGLPRTTRVEA